MEIFHRIKMFFARFSQDFHCILRDYLLRVMKRGVLLGDCGNLREEMKIRMGKLGKIVFEGEGNRRFDERKSREVSIVLWLE
jgi:hypothetical protein